MVLDFDQNELGMFEWCFFLDIRIAEVHHIYQIYEYTILLLYFDIDILWTQKLVGASEGHHLAIHKIPFANMPKNMETSTRTILPLDL